MVSKRVEISLRGSSKKEIVGKQYKICESQIWIMKGLLFLYKNKEIIKRMVLGK